MYSLGYVVLLASVTLVQCSSGPGYIYQVNSSICNWSQFRASQIRGSVYLNGGSQWWERGFSDGTLSGPQNYGGSEATIFELPLSTAWDNRTTNLSGLFSQNSDLYYAPINFIDGMMFADDDKLLLYGGLTRPTDTDTVPGPRDILGVQQYRGGSDKRRPASIFFNSTLPEGMTRYITNGAGENVPSENMGYYLGGMRGTTWGPIELDAGSANATASALISVNMTDTQGLDWKNATLPSFVSPRAEAELVWVPVSHRGALVAIGGVVDPEIVYSAGLSSAQKSLDKSTDPKLMKTIAIYDIASQTWFLQDTTGDIPPGMAMFCSVLASAPDGSSHNIYVYGGYNGYDSESTPFDDVYILSLPSFVWIKAYSGITRHGRSGHQCFRVFPDQMLVIGGLFQDPSMCLQGGVLQLFNLNTLEFQNSYGPSSWQNYTIPDVITRQIGGSGDGGANRTAPDAWASDQLEALFSLPYQKPISTWYPYATPGNQTTSPASSAQGQSNTWVIAVAVGLSIPSVSALGLWVLFQHKRNRNHRHRLCCWPQKWLVQVGFRKAPLIEAGGTEISCSPRNVRDKSNGHLVELDGTPPDPMSDVSVFLHASQTSVDDALASPSYSRTPPVMYGQDSRDQPPQFLKL